MTNHVFVNHCVDWEALLTTANLDKMIDAVYKQSKLPEAKMRVDIAHYKDYGANEFCPTYFGMFVEWFAGHFLSYFGHNFNIESVNMLDVEGNTEQDSGVDGSARTVKKVNKTEFTSTGRLPVQGSPIYIQVKGTKDRFKEFSPNDGTRLPNFMTHAQMLAMKAKKAYQARYILFTTGHGIDYKMDNMSGGLMEVINYKIIKHHTKDNGIFLNILRANVGLEPLPLLDSPIDADAPVFDEEPII
jgi:hypothetical protein